MNLKGRVMVVTGPGQFIGTVGAPEVKLMAHGTRIGIPVNNAIPFGALKRSTFHEIEMPKGGACWARCA